MSLTTKLSTMLPAGNRWRILLRSLFIAGLATLLGVLTMSAVQGEKNRHCQTLQIGLDPNQDLFFVDPQMIRNQLGKLDADTFIGRAMAEIDLQGIEASLEKMDHVEEAEAWIGNSGALCIQIVQREPILRVIHNKGVSYYLDIHGKKMPSTRTFTARVPVLTGMPSGEGETLSEVVGLATFIHHDAFLSAMIEQIERTDRGEYILVPKVGNHTVLLGDASDLEQKFRKLETVYRDGLNYTGWDQYRTLDLRYQDLVYGTRQ